MNGCLQDLKIHHSEILGKFVAIMRERLTASLRQLPAAASQWRYSADSAQGQQQQYTPSPFATSLTKQLRILAQVPQQSLPLKLHRSTFSSSSEDS